MANIHKYTWWLQVISIIFAVILFGEICLRWFLYGFAESSEFLSDLYLRGSYTFDGNWVKELSQMSFVQKLLGFAVDGIALGIICTGIFAFNRLLSAIKNGIFFTSDIIQLLSTISKFALVWAIYNPIRTTLLSILTTLHKGPGNRIISFQFGLKDMINIFIFVCIILVTALIKEGFKLKKEQDLTI